jgi:hypothetical protein
MILNLEILSSLRHVAPVNCQGAAGSEGQTFITPFIPVASAYFWSKIITRARAQMRLLPVISI